MIRHLRALFVVATAVVYLPLYAKHFTFDEIHLMPTGIEKDYYIWRFLRQPDTTSVEARKIIREASRINRKLKKAYRKKTGCIPYIKPMRVFYYKQLNNESKFLKTQADFAFEKALAYLRKGQTKRAKDFLRQAERLFAKRYKKDKALFWLYLTTKSKRYLHKLLNSSSVNLYTLLAADILRKPYPDNIIVPKSARKRNKQIDATDPIAWTRLKYKIFRPHADYDALIELCDAEDTVGMKTFIQERACNYTKAYFPMPYRDFMERFSIERQALIYAIARQESRFVPGSVSTSFALGLMQIMPFLIDHIAKERGESIDYDDIFDPLTAITYANHHLNYLTNYFYHPLFVAYAYNGGIGFTRQILLHKKMFRKGKYEPYMSMETLPNLEAREYGKRVLVNYVVYLNLLGKPTRLLPFIEDLTDPFMTDRFRHKKR